jgi:3',5'-nucleoside bisphosphate phosphatase
VADPLRQYKAELHLHTVLSPCAAVEMIPPLIIQTAQERLINLIAVTDHNSTGNIKAVMQAAQSSDIVVLPGMELQTREEIHSLCLFDTLEQIEQFQEVVSKSLPDIQNRADTFGEQFIVDASGDFIRREERMLLTSSSLSLKTAWETVNRLGGLLIPAHVNRTVFGLLPVLGFVPEDISLEALEISRQITPSQARQQYPQLKKYPLIQNGDAHQLEDILGVTTYTLVSPNIGEIRMALKGFQGRSFEIKPIS